MFKPGDRVVYIAKQSYAGYKQFDKGTVISLIGGELVLKFDNGYKNNGQDPTKFQLEELYNTRLAEAMRENS